MILFRARAIASRHEGRRGNDPAERARGRFFTSSISAAAAHRATLKGPTEIVAVDVPDDVAATHLVANTPITRCGIDAGALSAQPTTDYLLPMFRVSEAEALSEIAVRALMPAHPVLSLVPLAA